MDASLVVQCSFSVQIVWCLLKAISESAKPHETSRMVWSFGGLCNKNPKKFWRHGKREEVGFMWIRMLLGCISTSISQQSSQQCVTLERFQVSKRKELLAVQVGWSFKRKSDEKTGNCPYWMGKPQSAFEARSQHKPNSIKSHETIPNVAVFSCHTTCNWSNLWPLLCHVVTGLRKSLRCGSVHWWLCVYTRTRTASTMLSWPVHMLMMIVFVHICAYFAVYAQIRLSAFWHFHLTTSHMGGSHVPAFQEQICESLGGAQRLRKQGVIQTDLAIHFIFLTAISLHIHCCHTQDHIKPNGPTFHTVSRWLSGFGGWHLAKTSSWNQPLPWRHPTATC